jgi:hypothetical protein
MCHDEMDDSATRSVVVYDEKLIKPDVLISDVTPEVIVSETVDVVNRAGSDAVNQSS